MASKYIRYYCLNTSCHADHGRTRILALRDVSFCKDGSAECRFCWGKAEQVHLLWCVFTILQHLCAFVVLSLLATKISGNLVASVLVIANAWWLLSLWNVRRNRGRSANGQRD